MLIFDPALACLAFVREDLFDPESGLCARQSGEICAAADDRDVLSPLLNTNRSPI